VVTSHIIYSKNPDFVINNPEKETTMFSIKFWLVPMKDWLNC
jgi:hypothetical protein